MAQHWRFNDLDNIVNVPDVTGGVILYEELGAIYNDTPSDRWAAFFAELNIIWSGGTAPVTADAGLRIEVLYTDGTSDDLVLNTRASTVHPYVIAQASSAGRGRKWWRLQNSPGAIDHWQLGRDSGAEPTQSYTVTSGYEFPLAKPPAQFRFYLQEIPA